MRVQLTEGRMLLDQKLLNHPVFILPAWQLKGCQTLLQFVIYTQLRWFGAQVPVCVCVYVCARVCLYFVSSLFCLPYHFHILFSVHLPICSALFPSILLVHVAFVLFPYLSFLCLLKCSTSSCVLITSPFSLITSPASSS